MEQKQEITTISCLNTILQEVQNSEQTQEIKLPEGMPDIGHILSAWGQPILRSKEWRGDSVFFSGGMMVWVLYGPEDGSPEQCIDAWVPFQMKWGIPEDVPEGDIRIQLLPRFVDARNVSPRKILVRTGLAARAEAYVPRTVDTVLPGEVPEGVELLRMTYPVRLEKEAGEKTFLIDEMLSLPESAPEPEQVIYYRMLPRMTEGKVLSNKLVFRGNGNLHMLYRSREGQLHSWDFDLPFSQFTQLGQEYGADAQADLALSPTNLELEMSEEGNLRIKAGMVGQYVVSDKQMLELVEDAYSPGQELVLQEEELELPVVLENRTETVRAEQAIPALANLTADVSFLPDFPRQKRRESEMALEMPGTFQVLYYGEDGALHAGTARWEGNQTLWVDSGSQLQAVPGAAHAQGAAGNGQILAKAEYPMEITTSVTQHFSMITAVKPGQPRQTDPSRPALILERAGDKGLWELAKANNSTMDAIRKANHLQADPQPGQMLLIPVS